MKPAFAILGGYLLLATGCATTGTKKNNDSYVEWDPKTLCKVSSSTSRYAGYPRLAQLRDGTLLCVYETNGNVVAVRSGDVGGTWSAEQIVVQGQPGVMMAVPEILPLADGSILVSYNVRPAPNTGKRFGIRTIKSYDGGESWEDDRLLYEAGTDFHNGCWEPAAIQLPDGTIQLYFSNEGIYTETEEQDISMLTSHDGGLTWSSDLVIASFRKGHRDGMPSPMLLRNGKEIVFAIEDNLGHYFSPAIIRTSVTNPWPAAVGGESDQRNFAFAPDFPAELSASAPCLRQLSTGETLLSYQGSNQREETLHTSTMRVVVGDSEARNFRNRTAPFKGGHGKFGLWNSIAVLRDDTIIALSSTNAYSETSVEVWMIKGRLVSQ